MIFYTEKTKVDDYLKEEKKDERRAILIFIAVETLILFSSYTNLSDYKIIFYALIVPLSILASLLVCITYRVAINKALDTTISLEIEGSKMSATMRRFLLWKRKDLCLNLRDIKVEPFVFAYKRNVYVESYSLAIKVNNRRLLIVKDFYPEFDKLVKELQDRGANILPPSFEVRQLLKKEKK